MKKIKNKSFVFLSLSPLTMLFIPQFIVSCSNSQSNPPIQNQPEVLPSIDETGGQINNLQVSSYLEVVKELNLSSKSKLDNLNDNLLNEQLHKIEKYKNLNIEIQVGSNNKNGVLNLKLTGNFNNQQINSDIEIKGFEIMPLSSFEVSRVEINEDNYFDSFQPIVESTNQNITSDLEVKKSLINNAIFIFDNNKQLSWNEIVNNYEILNISITKKQSNQLNFSFRLSWSPSTYNGTTWIKDSNAVELSQNSNKVATCLQPNLKALKLFMLNKLTLNENNLMNYFPSYYKGMFKLSNILQADRTGLVNNIENVDAVFNKYKSSYFPNNDFQIVTYFQDENSLIVNDENGNIEFFVRLKDSNDENDLSVMRKFDSNKLKNLNSVLDEQKGKINNLVIKNNSTSQFANQIKKVFRAEIQSMFDQSREQTLNLSSEKIKNLLITNWSHIYNEQNDINKNAEIARRINDSFTLSIMNTIIEEDAFSELNGNFSQHLDRAVFDYSTGLFSKTARKTNCFMMNSVGLNFDNLSIVAKMTNNTNLIAIEINAKMQIQFNMGSNSDFEQDTIMVLYITRSSWT